MIPTMRRAMFCTVARYKSTITGLFLADGSKILPRSVKTVKKKKMAMPAAAMIPRGRARCCGQLPWKYGMKIRHVQIMFQIQKKIPVMRKSSEPESQRRPKRVRAGMRVRKEVAADGEVCNKILLLAIAFEEVVEGGTVFLL